MEACIETAGFRGDDDDLLVRASLACRRCLADSVAWELELEQWDAALECACRSCGYRRKVFLTGEQALRLQLERDRTVGRTRGGRSNAHRPSRVERCDARARRLRTG